MEDIRLRGRVRDLESLENRTYRPGIEWAGGLGRYFREGVAGGLFLVCLIVCVVLVMVFRG